MNTKMLLRPAMLLASAAVWIAALGPAQVATAVTIENEDGWTLPGAGNAFSSPDPFDIMGGSSLVVAISAERRALVDPPIIESVSFGAQPLELIGRISDTQPATGNNPPNQNPGQQLIEFWYLDEAFNSSATIAVNWDTTDSGTPVNGIGLGALSINEVEGLPTLFQGNDGLSTTINVPADLDAPIGNSLVVAGFVANPGADPTGDGPLTTIYSGDIGSADAAAAYENNVGPGSATYSFTGGGSRPVTFAAVFETGPMRLFNPPVPGDTDGDGDVDVDDYNNIIDSLGYTGVPQGFGVTQGVGPDIAGADGLIGADGVVDFRDLRLWQANFTISEGSGSTFNIPEPSTCCLGIILLTAAAYTKRR